MSPRAKEFTERINVFFSKEQLKLIEAEAEKLGLTVSAYVRMAVVKAVNRDNELIERQAAVNALMKLGMAREHWSAPEGIIEQRGIDAAICAIEDLPSV